MTTQVLNNEKIINSILSNFNEKELVKVFLINKSFYKCAYFLYHKRKQIAIQNAKESIEFYEKYEKHISPDILSTMCFELLNNHMFFLSLNWNNFTKRLIHDIDKIVKQKQIHDVKLNLIIPELVRNRNKIILSCQKHVDLFKYSVTELRMMLKELNYKRSKLKKEDMIEAIKSY